MLFLVFDLCPLFLFLLTFIFASIFFFARKIPCQNFFGLFFHRLNDLFLGYFKINTISAVTSALFKLAVRLPICLLKFHFFFGKIFQFLPKFQFFKKGVSIEKPFFPLCACMLH